MNFFSAAIVSMSTILIPQLFATEELSKNLAACASTNGDMARLECYDNLSRKNNLTVQRKTAPQKVGGIGKWIVSSENNPIDDSTTVTLFVRADSGNTKFDNSTSMAVRCKTGEIEVYISWGHYLGSDNSHNVLVRVGKSKAEKSKWGLSTDRKGTFHPNPKAFLKSMLAETSLVAQTIPYNESPVIAVFNIEGINNAVGKLKEACPLN